MTQTDFDDDLRPEYKKEDLGNRVRGKYYQRVIEKSNVVLLDDEVAEVFPNSESVNEALKMLIRISKSTVKP